MLNFSNQINYNPPSHNELEVSVFGPGIGECVVLHIGNNEWIIIDSCLEPSTKKPVALEYLSRLGIDCSTDVKLFLITHWHSDHIKGGAEIAEYCDSATICFSDTFLKEEFLTLVDCYSGLEQPVLVDRQTCATREIASIISIIKRRVEKYNKNKPFPYSFASADKRIYQQKYGDDPTEIWALSPSPQALIDSLIEISSLIPSAKEKIFRKVTPRPTQNKNAVALLVKSNKICFLLGADLEETKSPLTGWSVIVNSPNRPQDKSMIFKIPHHGSENGHSHDVWTEMLLKDAIGILTTKIGGRSNIPKPSDIKRLRKYTPNLFCAPEPLPSKKKRDRTVEKTMNEIAKRRIPLNGKMGYIQIRTGMSPEVSVGLKIPAKKL